MLLDFITNDDILREKFYKVRGVFLERKIEGILRNYLGDDVVVHREYYTNSQNEQDILILANNLELALIVEAKSSKIKEHKVTPFEAYGRILSNFEEVIQKGYDQCYRVKKRFIAKEKFDIYKEQQLKNKIANINTKKYYNSFSLVVTLERFGQIQTNLSSLLRLENDDSLPWSVCIDDLEVFLLAMKRKKMNPKYLIKYLRIRKKIHQNVICNDELDICGLFIDGKLEEGGGVITSSMGSKLFDDMYHNNGLGFKNEKNMDLKNKRKYHVLGS